MNVYIKAKNGTIAAKAAAEQATADKKEALEELVEAMKSDIRYAQNAVDFDDDKLKLIGWAGRKERTPLALPAGLWEEAATAVITEATLVEQPRGKELEYRIVAINKAGDGKPSNTVMVVL